MNRIIKINYTEESEIIFVNTSNVKFFKIIKDTTFHDLYQFYIDDVFRISFISESIKEKIECFLQYGETREHPHTKYETIILKIIDKKIASVSYTGIIKK
jgi:hypothetical protein